MTLAMAELAAIRKAACLVGQGPWGDGHRVRIFTDSKAAIRAIAWPRRNEDQELVASIYRTIGNRPVTIHWVPGHDTCPGNNEANRLAKSATQLQNPTLQARPAAMPLSSVRKAAKRCEIKPQYDAFAASKAGEFTKRIDRALPGKHTRTLYDGLKRSEAAVLSQIRTGIARVNKYLAKIKAAESELCKHCQLVETIPHLLFTCSRWEHLRTNMRAVHGRRYGDLSYALGGYNDARRNGEPSKWKPDLKAVKATIEFVMETGRLDYVPNGHLQAS